MRVIRWINHNKNIKTSVKSQPEVIMSEKKKNVFYVNLLQIFKRTNADNLNSFCFHVKMDVDDKYKNRPGPGVRNSTFIPIVNPFYSARVIRILVYILKSTGARIFILHIINFFFFFTD